MDELFTIFFYYKMYFWKTERKSPFKVLVSFTQHKSLKEQCRDEEVFATYLVDPVVLVLC